MYLVQEFDAGTEVWFESFLPTSYSLFVQHNQIIWDGGGGSQNVSVFVRYSYFLWHTTVLCGTNMFYALLLIIAGAP